MQTQIPFTGGCGVLLDQAFQTAHVRKEEVFISNVVHCHPPNNRPSLPLEIINCRGYLHEELQIVSPSIVVALGKDAAEWFLGPIDELRATVWRPHQVRDYIVYAAYHPSYVMKQPRHVRERYVEMLAHIVGAALGTGILADGMRVEEPLSLFPSV